MTNPAGVAVTPDRGAFKESETITTPLTKMVVSGELIVVAVSTIREPLMQVSPAGSFAPWDEVIQSPSQTVSQVVGAMVRIHCTDASVGVAYVASTTRVPDSAHPSPVHREVWSPAVEDEPPNRTVRSTWVIAPKEIQPELDKVALRVPVLPVWEL